MSAPLLLEGTLPRRGRRGAGQAATVSEPSSRVPRIARLVALAWHIEEQVRLGTLGSYAAAARLGHVSRARLSQILSLLNLAPDLQEQVLFLQRPIRGRQGQLDGELAVGLLQRVEVDPVSYTHLTLPTKA